MAAAEYYNATAAAQLAQTAPSAPATQHYSPQQHHSPRPPTHELHGSPVPQYSLPPSGAPQRPPPPPYYPVQQDQKPSVHFSPTLAPNSGPPSRPHSSRPSFSGQQRPNQTQHLRPPPHHPPYAQHSSPNIHPQAVAQQPHMRPYMHENQSAYSISNGYSSDPEQRRRRRHKRHDREDRRDDQERSRDQRQKKDRSRSTNTDGLLGAAGGGLIGDLIFPGLGTVGGALAGWIGGRDYGKHRKYREGKLDKDQKDWEHRFRDRSDSRERRYSDDRHGDHRRHHSSY